MKPKKPRQPIKKDKDWQKKVEERIKSERVELDHPKGKGRFERIIKKFVKKKNAN